MKCMRIFMFVVLMIDISALDNRQCHWHWWSESIRCIDCLHKKFLRKNKESIGSAQEVLGKTQWETLKVFRAVNVYQVRKNLFYALTKIQIPVIGSVGNLVRSYSVTLACPRISNMRNPYGTKHFQSHLENEMLKNQKILKIGPRLGVPISNQSFSI